jgi:hypothetical protein
MCAAVTDAERVAARNGPGLARQFDDCTFIRTEFRPLKPTVSAFTDLPVTPVRSPPKDLAGMESPVDPLGREMKQTGANNVANQTVVGRSTTTPGLLTPSPNFRHASAHLTPSPAGTVVGADHDGHGGDEWYREDATSLREHATVLSQHLLKQTSLLEARMQGTATEWETPAQIDRAKKNEALHARLMKSGYYSAAAKVRPLYN